MITWKKYITLIACCAMAAMACKKVDVSTPDDFNVQSDKATYKAGDTALFTFSGTANIITFWSGELGKNYDNKDRTIQAGIPKLLFQTNMTQGVLTNPDSLRLYVSTNLKGYDSASVLAATWTDITTRNTKWPTALTTTFTTSDSITLTDFNTADSINIAFRATGRKYATAAQRRWQIQNLTLTNFLADGSSTALFSTFANTGWVQANIKNNPTPSQINTNFHAWNVGQAGVNANNSTFIISGRACNSSGIPIQTAYPITFDPSTVVNMDENDDWLITSPINLKTTKPDAGTAIKKQIDVTLTSYKYRFATPGVYTVVFVAQNQALDEQQMVVRKLTITVTP